MIPVTSGPGWLLLALLLVGGTFALAVALVRRAARMPAAFALAAGLAILVCVETLTMNALSLVDGVTRAGVAWAHAALLAAGGAALLATRGPGLPFRAALRGLRRAPLPAALVLPLAALAAASALRWAPNTGDSMTYHLARVAHWIQTASVGLYPTSVLRQSVMMPGAEYVLLALQAVSGSDRLAALLQLGAYLVLVVSAPPLARLAGAPRRHAPWAAPLMAALPMAALQASSTQNDLVAAALAVAVVAASLRLRRGETRAPILAARASLLGAALAAAFVVKASAVLAALPIVLLLAVRALASRRRVRAGPWLVALAAAAAIAVLVAAPELERRGTADQIVSVYPALSEWGDRAANVVRGVLHHLPPPPGTPAAVLPRLTTRPGSLVPGLPQLVPHEDVVGAPLHAGAVLAALAALAAGFARVPRRGRWAIAGALAAWVLFHVTLRDNEYVPRLHLPLFALAPAFLAALPARVHPRWSAGAAVVAACLGLAVAASNRLRPPLAARAGPVVLDYYRNDELVRDAQLTALRAASAGGCRRIGLFMGESGFEYPITWQAMQVGIETRHLFGSASWPCLVYAEPSSFGLWNIPRAPVALDPAEWAPAASNPGGVFLYRRIRAPRTGGG